MCYMYLRDERHIKGGISGETRGHRNSEPVDNERDAREYVIDEPRLVLNRWLATTRSDRLRETRSRREPRFVTKRDSFWYEYEYLICTRDVNARRGSGSYI